MAVVKLNAAIEGISGRTGNAVFAMTKEGTQYKSRPTKNDPKTPAQVAQRARVRRASQLYSTFTPQQAKLWNDYAAKLVHENKASGKESDLTGLQAFVQVTSKFLAVSPNGTIPLVPPAEDFDGDSVVVTCSAVSGKMVFTASKANGTDITTELLIQPLASGTRKPSSKGYRSNSFVTFATGSLTATISDLPAGYYATAYRFINTKTGQDIDIITLPVFKLG